VAQESEGAACSPWNTKVQETTPLTNAPPKPKPKPLPKRPQRRDVKQKKDHLVITDEVNIWELDGQRWKSIPARPKMHLWFHATAFHDRSFIVTGGANKEGLATKDVFQYSINTGKWITLPPFNIPRRGHSSVFFNGFLYVIGGSRSMPSCRNAVEKFDFCSQQWTDLQPLPKDRNAKGCDPFAISANRRLYVFRDDMNMLDEDDRGWIRKPDLPFGIYYSCPAAIKDEIYVIDGVDLWCFDTKTNIWTTLRSSAFQHLNSCCVAYKNKIVVLGGTQCDQIEEYDMDADEWKTWKIAIPKAVKTHSIFAFFI
jgi:hypothetical protein